MNTKILTRLLRALTGMACLVWPSAGAVLGPVRVVTGWVEGVAGADPAITVFRGIPYAAPPVGGNRWRAPQPAAAWPGVRKADRFCASCMQNIVTEHDPWTYEFLAHNETSEDCLFLNVWTAAKSADEKRPVFFWIHGGANTEGSSTVPVYDGEGLAGKGVVVVVINYRLGILGWFGHPELAMESEPHVSGNYGLLDQIAALRWVHDNIRAFGGDPDRITIAGQSAGAGAVHTLTASPLAKGLFARAIAQSGSGISGFTPRTRAELEQDGVRFAQAKGAESLAQLRAMDWQTLTAPVAAKDGKAGAVASPSWRFGPVIDGWALPASVREIFAAGKQNDVPTLTGCNADEGGAVPNPRITREDYEAQARRKYGDQAEAFLALYPAATADEAGRALNESARDQARVSMYLWARHRAQTAKTPAYSYFWTHALPGPDANRFGAFHTSEVPYVFDSLRVADRPFTAADHRIADTLSTYWANFAANGNPNGGALIPWPAIDGETAQTMQLGDDCGPMPIASSPARQRFHEQFLSRVPSPPANRAGPAVPTRKQP